MHATLKPKNNLRLLAIWAAATITAALFYMRPMLWRLALAAATLGAIAGYLQLRALRQSSTALLAADSAISIRRALLSSLWGKLYITLFWSWSIALFILAFTLFADAMTGALILGYCSFALLRELIALPGLFALQRLENTAEHANANP